MTWAQDAGASNRTRLDHKEFANREAFDEAMHAALVDAGVDLVALAGFMRIQSAGFVEQVGRAGSSTSTPRCCRLFKGLHPHKQALDAGVRISGCTVHFVTAEMDSGPIVAQAAVPVLDGDTPGHAWRTAFSSRSTSFIRTRWRLVASGARPHRGGHVTDGDRVSGAGRCSSRRNS